MSLPQNVPREDLVASPGETARMRRSTGKRTTSGRCSLHIFHSIQGIDHHCHSSHARNEINRGEMGRRKLNFGESSIVPSESRSSQLSQFSSTVLQSPSRRNTHSLSLSLSSIAPGVPQPDPFRHFGKSASRPVPPPEKRHWMGAEEGKTKLSSLFGGVGAMAAPSARKRLQEETTCSVCLDYFTAPVTLDCGHNFCRDCIVKSWGESPTEAPCPECRERVPAKKLRPNRQLASVVEIAKELSEPPKLEAAEWRVCERHQEPVKLFCQDDEAPMCVVCDRSKEHRAHKVVPVEEAVQENKDHINRFLKILRKERENILEYKAENEKESQDLLKQTEAEREKMSAAFRELRQFLDEQEKLLLAQTEEVEKEIARKRDEHLARLSGELSSLDSLIREMEEKQQQSANELLQNVGNTLQRCRKEMLKNPVTFPVALKWRIHDFCDINPFLEVTMKQFKDTLVSGLLPFQEANVTLDPDTAHPRLILTEDCKTVRWGDERQALPNNPERFEFWPLVLGREGFTAGRHFWEVTVGSKAVWAVGVARKSVRRKGKLDCSPKEGIWTVGKWRGEYRFASASHCPPLSLSQEPKRIRVTLNCAGGRVAFFDADTGAQLYAYSEASFGRETLLPLFYVFEGGHLILLS